MAAIPNQIKDLGFAFIDQEVLEDGSYYEVYIYETMADFPTLEATFEYNSSGELLKYYFEVENLRLNLENADRNQIKNLIKFIYG